MITINTILDMRPNAIPKVIHLSQYDSDFSLVFRLHASFGVLNIESGTTAEIRGTKKSGTGYSAAATLNASNNTVTVAGDAQMTAVAGQNTYEIILKKSGKVLGSANFVLLVERAALDADTITDASVLRELNAIVEGAETATQAAEEAEDAADRAEAAAQSLEIDDTLTQEGQAADAKAVGDAITGLEDDIAQIDPGLSDEAKVALLTCFQHVAWTDENGQDYYDALYDALYGGDTPTPTPTPVYPKITAVFNPGTRTVYAANSFSSVQDTLDVTYYENENSEGVVLAKADYTLEGNAITAGINRLTVVYNDLRASVSVTAKAPKYSYSLAQGELTKHVSSPNGVAGGGYKVPWMDGNTNRRIFSVSEGYCEYGSSTAGERVSGAFVIPFPSDKTIATVSVTPSSMYLSISAWGVSKDPNSGLYHWFAKETGWQLGSAQIEYEGTWAKELVINLKYNSAGTSFQSEPTDLVVQFS